MQKEIRCPFCSEIVTPEDIKLGCHRSECDKEFPEDFIEKHKERLFKINSKINDPIDYFKLDVDEQRLFHSLQYYLTNKDIKNTNDPEKKKNKKSWITIWGKQISKNLKSPIVKNEQILIRGLKELALEKPDDCKLGNILLETYTFRPYYNLNPNVEKVKLKYNIEKHEKYWMDEIYGYLGVDKSLCQEAVENYKIAFKKIPPSKLGQKLAIIFASGVVLAITGGAAAPALGGFIGSLMGLYGAAAVSAGLAFLGGGAIVAGGFGMAGGTAVIIGGGAILGIGVGSGISKIFSNSSLFTLEKLAKLESVIKTYLRKNEDYKNIINISIKEIENIKESIEEVKTVDIINSTEKYSKEEMESIQKSLEEAENTEKYSKEELESIKYCKNAITRLTDMYLS